jgi:hypothetical protein
MLLKSEVAKPNENGPNESWAIAASLAAASTTAATHTRQIQDLSIRRIACLR